jgi:hypothetical protein
MILDNFHCPDDPLKYEIYHTTDQSGAPTGDYGCTNYLGVMGTTEFANDGILLHSAYNGAINEKQVTDGLSHTIVMGERGISDDLYGWPYCGAGDVFGTGDGDNLMSTELGLSVGYPDGNHDYHFWSYHPNMSQFVWADGSAKPLTYDIDLKVFQALSMRAGREVFQEP